jgi:hypothetical protein
LFPKLPKELQKKIWEDAAANLYSRLITIAPGGSPPPGVFHASYDSRKAALKNYERHIYRDRNLSAIFPIIVDYEMDFVCVNGQGFLDEDVSTMLERVIAWNASRYASFKYMVIEVQEFVDEANRFQAFTVPSWWAFDET